MMDKLFIVVQEVTLRAYRNGDDESCAAREDPSIPVEG